MDKKKLLKFLLESRENTYTKGGGKTKPLLPGSVQMEFSDGGFLYRDIYNIGNGIFIGIETVYLENKPVWSMSYFGNFSKISEEETDKILRSALIKFKDETRLWKNIEWESGIYRYVYAGNGEGIDEIGGTEEIYKNKKLVYYFYCAGGYIKKSDFKSGL